MVLALNYNHEMRLLVTILFLSTSLFGQSLKEQDLIGTWEGSKKDCSWGPCRDLQMEYSIDLNEVAAKFKSEDEIFAGGTYYQTSQFIKGKHPGNPKYNHTLKLQGNTLTICDLDGCHEVNRTSNDPHALRQLLPGDTSH